MNNELKELIETLKEYGDGFSNVLAPTEESVKALLDYINQLETNIDDAIGYIRYCQTSDKDIFPVIEAEKMIEILKGSDK